MERLKQIELDMLKAFCKICRRHGLRYYMTPPPVEQQVTHHDTDVIDLDHPYTDYIK